MKKYIKHIIIGLCFITFLVSICFIPIRASKLIPIIEEQVAENLGVKVHIERLILRMGPTLKVKTPIMHIMYIDGQKFAQFNNVKFYIPWSSILRDRPVIKFIEAKKITVRVNSDDEYLVKLIETFNNKEFKELPNIKAKEYHFSYLNKDNNDKYSLEGQYLDLRKIAGYKNFRFKTSGSFSINSIKHISYDLALLPLINIDEFSINSDIEKYINQIKDLDFHSDIMADIKLYRNQDKFIQSSGYINIDNISVLDIEKKNPKSFIYLTLWGDKASILSNIYTSLNKKIYIEGMINNSQKHVIDLKVKTDEIELLDLYKKIKVLTSFSYFKNIQSLNGTLNANFNLKGDVNKIKSSGYLKLKNAKITANGVTINNIDSDIDFSNNTINIVKAVGYVNDSPIIAKGKIDKKIDIELLMNKVNLKHLTPPEFGVKEGVMSLIANINGTIDNIRHKENLLIENLKIINKDTDLSISSLKFDTNKNNIAYINNVLCKSSITEVLKIPSVKLHIDSDRIYLLDTDIYMPNSKLTAKGEILNFSNNDITFSSSLEGFINSNDLKNIKTDSTRYPLKLSFNGNKNLQNINALVLLEKTDIFDEPTLLNLTSKIEKNTIKIEDLSVISFSGNNINEYKSNSKTNKKLIITGLLDDFKALNLKNIRIFIPQQLSVNIFDTIAQIKGDLFINGNIKNPEIIGQLTIQNLFNQPTQLSASNCTLDFNKNNVILNVPQVKILDTVLGFNALISTDLSEVLTFKNINIKSKYVNTDTLLMYKDSPFIKNLPIIIQDGKFYSEKVFANIYNTPVYFTAFTSDIKLDNEKMYLKNIASEVFNGKISGNIIYNLRDEIFESKIMARGVSAGSVFDLISTRKDSISGSMDLDADLSGELTSKKSLNGNIKFIINNGRMSTLGKLEHLLYAQNVVADHMLRTSLSVVTKAITLKDTGLFKFLKGDIDINNGIANIKFLQSQGPLMALYIKGEYNPLNDYAKLVVLGRLSDELVNGLGAFADFSLNKLMVMLTGEEGQKNNILLEDLEKLPQLQAKNTKEFRSIINGIIDKPSSVVLFNWISYSQKSLKQKEVPMTNVKVPNFVEQLPY